MLDHFNIVLDLSHSYKGYISLNGQRFILPNNISRKLRIWSISPIKWEEYKEDLPKTWREVK